MYHALMVPLDGSPFGEHALPLALAIARRSGAHLHLVHAHVTDAHPSAERAHGAQRRERERAYLTGVAERLAIRWHGTIGTALIDGPVAQSIAAYAEAQGIDLVVMTTHGRGALSRAWLGSVASRLLHRLPMPMLVIRPHETDPADLGDPPRASHVLIPLDGSALAETIVPHAIALGQPTHATYTLLQVIELPVTDYGFGAAPLAGIDVNTWMQEAQQQLEHVATDMRAAGLQVTTEVRFGWPALSILDYARDCAVDVIALATHGRSGAERLFLGSVADKVVRSAAVPVLLYRPPTEPTAAPTLQGASTERGRPKLQGRDA
ncbi:MAG: universal stress protein [Chloroflexales bacterium]|nr:universal stress protein [Chloroflexales bacterium]